MNFKTIYLIFWELPIKQKYYELMMFMEFLVSYYKYSVNQLFMIFVFILFIRQAYFEQDYYFHIHFDLFNLNFDQKIVANHIIFNIESMNYSYLIQLHQLLSNDISLLLGVALKIMEEKKINLFFSSFLFDQSMVYLKNYLKIE